MSWRDLVFKNRGLLIAVPASSIALLGKPSSASVALGLPLAFAGEALRCWAVGYSGVTTRANTVTAPALVTAGPYAYMRNPLYAGNFLTALGFGLAFTGRLGARGRTLALAGGLGTMAAVYATIIPLEESYLRRTFGDDFARYCKRVPRIVPLRSAAEPQAGRYDARTLLRAESRTFVTFAAMLAALAFKAARG